MRLPAALYSSAQVRAIDRLAIETLGIPGYALMCRAGEAAVRCLRSRWPAARGLAVVCGAGNNGGDGYVTARLARDAGFEVRVLAVTPPERLRGDALRACEDWRAGGGSIQPCSAQALAACDVLVDGLLGTGLAGEVRAESAQVIAAINASGRAVLALDVPSGLDADTGVPLGAAVRAECTVTFVALKTGLFLGEGPSHSGVLYFDDLSLTDALPQMPVPRLERLLAGEIEQALPPRARAANKGDFGHVLIVGGGPGMPGAARLAGEACLRVGAGRVTVAVEPRNVAAVGAGRPELMCRAVQEPAEVHDAAARCDLIAVGPGLGQDAWARGVLDAVLGCGKPLVVDADALNLLAAAPTAARPDWVLTPHPGEAGRLLGCPSAAVQRDRPGALDALLARYGGTVVLKGAGSLVGRAGEVPALCEHGNPGMASPGMGDVLTGVIAGIWAQCRDPWRAARTGVLVHALAGDAAARREGERGVLAGDVIRELRRCVNV
ncbi:MAG: NAD(P)H-hydrate dehydratase [Steroidobacteraceae bacterium]